MQQNARDTHLPSTASPISKRSDKIQEHRSRSTVYTYIIPIHINRPKSHK